MPEKHETEEKQCTHYERDALPKIQTPCYTPPFAKIAPHGWQRRGQAVFFSFASNLGSKVEIAHTIEREEHTCPYGTDLHCAVQMKQNRLDAADIDRGVAKKRGSKCEGARAKTKHKR